jgi:ribonucleoside-diphosphate reductase alpha chain
MGEGLNYGTVSSVSGAPEAPRVLGQIARPLTWEQRFRRHAFDVRRYDAVIRRANGEEVFRLDGVEAPAHWGDTAINIAAQKYFIRKGAKTDDARERSVFRMLAGVADTIAASGYVQGVFASVSDSQYFQSDLYQLLVEQMGAFNSPVWFNVRHWYVHGIVGNGNNWAWDRETNGYRVIANSYERPQCSACFILPVEDTLDGENGIAETLMAETRVFKRGSGAGANFSRVRERGAPTASGHASSGVMSFLEVLDRNAGSIKSGSVARRAAKMVTLDVDHPEIEDFIGWKVREEKKAYDLMAAGWSGGMEGAAYSTVGGQNANNSVRVSDEFMQAVERDGDWDLLSRVGGHTARTVKARHIWHQIAKAAWTVADPGLQFDTTINDWHTTPNAGRIDASNPCSEYMHINDSACNLASIRLTKFLRPEGAFDTQGFRDACRTFIVAQEILVDLSSYPTRGIAEGAHRFRQLGLGYADLGALLMLLGYPYDSDAGRAVAAQITSLMTAEAYRTSAELARHLGPFEGYAADRENVLRIIAKHREAALTFLTVDTPLAKKLQEEACRVWGDALGLAMEYGVRHAQVTLLAPTGTIGFLMGCTTTGVEPLLAHRQYKTLAGGGSLVILNDIVEASLKNLGYGADAIQQITRYVETHGYFTGSPLLPQHLPIFDTAFPAHGDPENRSLSPEAHVRMVAAVQPFLSGAVSKTVNLPASATVEDIEAIHMLAWRSKLKAVAVYRDGSKGAQPVKTKAEASPVARVQLDKKGSTNPAEYMPREALTPNPVFKRFQRKLPKVRKGVTWALKLDEHKIYIRSGEYEDGSLGEIFVDLAKEGSTLGGLVGMWSKAISLAIQYGTPLEELVETFTYTRFEPFGRVLNHPTIRTATSIVDLVMRTLAVHYLGRKDLQHVQPDALMEGQIPPPTHPATPDEPQGLTAASGDGPPCPACGTITKRNGVCHRCPNCGESLGCS